MYNVLKRIAEINGVHPDEVEEEIKKAINIAMFSQDTTAKKFWIKFENKETTPEAVIYKIIDELKKKNRCS